MAITKCINSESKQYKPVLTDKLVLDDAPTVNSLNGVTSDAVARAIAGASGEVPQVTENDNGKVLTAIYDEGGAAVEWGEAASGLPESSSADEGKVLTVDAAGAAEWATPSGGGGSSTSAFDTTFNLVPDSLGGSSWKLSNSSSYYINLTGGAGVYAYSVVAEITDSANPTEIDDIYNVTVRVGNSATSSETKAIGLHSDISSYPDDPATISFKTGGVLNVVTNDQHVRGSNVSVVIRPAKTGGTAVTSFTGGSVTLYLAKLSTLSGGWQPES